MDQSFELSLAKERNETKIKEFQKIPNWCSIKEDPSTATLVLRQLDNNKLESKHDAIAYLPHKSLDVISDCIYTYSLYIFNRPHMCGYHTVVFYITFAIRNNTLMSFDDTFKLKW